MDVVEFLRDFRRMCSSYGGSCIGCGLRGAECTPTGKNCDHEKVIRVVEEWAKEHPVETRLSEIKKLFPNYNYPSHLPRACVRVFDCTVICRINCHECKKKFWLTPIKEEEK